MGEGMHGSDFRRPISIFTLAAELALWAAAFSCPLALGSASIWALWPLCILSATAAITGAVGSLRSHRSIAYHDFYWYPLIGKARVREALATPWGRLFREYEDGLSRRATAWRARAA